MTVVAFGSLCCAANLVLHCDISIDVHSTNRERRLRFGALERVENLWSFRKTVRDLVSIQNPHCLPRTN